jgi:hypothetical protein
LDFTVSASGRANEAARPIPVEDLDANLGDRATHDIVHARPAERIGPFEAGNATAAIVGMNRRGMDLSSVIPRCDHDCDAEQCYQSQSSSHLKPPFYRFKRCECYERPIWTPVGVLDVTTVLRPVSLIDLFLLRDQQSRDGQRSEYDYRRNPLR